MAFNFAHLLSAACGGAARRLRALRARFFSLFLSFSQCNFTEKMPFFSVYVALTNIPVGELLTGFAMRSDPNVVFG